MRVDTHRYARAIYYAGGVLANLLLLMILALSLWSFKVSPGTERLVEQVMLAQVIICAGTLFPYNWAGRVTDGLQLIRLLKKAPDFNSLTRLVYDNSVGRHRQGHATASKLSDASRRLVQAMMREERRNDVGIRQNTHAEVQDLLAANVLTPEDEMLALDFLITDGLTMPGCLSLEALDQWSKRALELQPHNATLRGSRGSVLIELGEFEEGREMLKSIQDVERRSFDALMIDTYMAQAELGLANRDAARTHAIAARDMFRTWKHSSMYPAIGEKIAEVLDQIDKWA